MKVLSLFDGISCGMLALQRAGVTAERYDSFEIDKYAIAISQKNYPDIKRYGNVFSGDFTQFKGYDLLFGGSPCTYWSIARKGRETTSDGIGFKLFLEYLRALEESKCRYFLYENNFSIHQNIKDEITKRLGVQPIMINSALVSAQQRKRCYWTNIPDVTQPEDKHIYLKDIIDTGFAVRYSRKNGVKSAGEKGLTFLASYYKGINRNQEQNAVAEPIRIGQYGKGGQGQRIYSVHGKSVTLSANGGGLGANTGLYKIDLPDGDYVIRKLTPIEAERLQTLPDNYTAGISDTQRYKCIGNGWTVDVIAHILKKIAKEMI